MRIEKDVTRGAAITIMVDGMSLPCFEGETIATAMLAHGQLVFRRDPDGHARGLYCNMGTCGECMVTIAGHGRRVRACVTDAHDRQDIRTDG